MYITIHLIKEKINHRRWTAGKKTEKSLADGNRTQSSHTLVGHYYQLCYEASCWWRVEGFESRRSLNFSQVSLQLQLSCKDHLCSMFIRRSNENFYLTSSLSLIP